jgi:hypothetical protein
MTALLLVLRLLRGEPLLPPPPACPDRRHPSWCNGAFMVKRNACVAERKRLRRTR